MRIVVALGGNALLPRGQPLTFEVQQHSAAAAARALAPVIDQHQVVITHGNGPQVGLLALQSEAYRDVAGYPLDVLVAESEGMIGYILENELDRVTQVPTLTILTRTVVRADDRAFSRPTKPIGPLYPDTPELRSLAAARGWALGEDGGSLRRLVASPDPVRVRQAPLIRSLIDQGILVVCAGGGGIPVVDEGGQRRGVEAVVDKDLASSLLARQLQADMLVCLTDVEGVIENWGEPGARLMRSVDSTTLRSMRFAPGSMAPKVEAACRFVESTGRSAAIGRLDEVTSVLAGEAGTLISPAGD